MTVSNHGSLLPKVLLSGWQLTPVQVAMPLLS